MTAFLCPVCGAALEEEKGCLRCGSGHIFDKARSGYVNLLPPNGKHAKLPGDNKLMVNARRDFLEKGYYAPFAEAVAAVAAKHLAGKRRPVLLDAGCGEGYYTEMVCRALAPMEPEVFAVDISKFAADKCAKRCKGVHCAVGSVYHLPLPAESCDGVVSLFAPYCGEEYLRVLKPGGIFLMGIPDRMHLWELKAALYEKPYENEVKDFALEGFELLENVPVEGTIHLPCNEDIRNLFSMTPYYYKSGVDTDEKLRKLEQLDTRIAFQVLAYRKA